MKKLLTLLVFTLAMGTFVAAQSNGGIPFCGYGTSNSSAWSGCNWPNWVVSWLQEGGAIPQPLAVRVIRESRAWGQALGLNQGQMIHQYNQGLLTIEYLATTPPPPFLMFRVVYGGVLDTIIIDNF